MLKRIFLVTAILAALGLVPLQAQEAKPETPAPAEKMPSPRLPPVLGQPINVKLDLTITDQSGPGQAVKRQLSMIVADQQRGSIRNRGFIALDGKGRFDVILNVDATPVLMPDKTIRLTIALEYAPKPDAENATTGEGRAHLNETLSLILVPGKSLAISQASDPTSDRKIIVEVVATILT